MRDLRHAVRLALGVIRFTLQLRGRQVRTRRHFGLWSLDWEVKDDTGLALRNVVFDHEKVLAKASMPVVRVKYDKERHWWNPFSLGGSREATGRCGPFQDRLSWTNIIPIVDCGDQKVCVQTYQHNGVKWLELGVYARIGEYHIYQVWYLSQDGEIHPIAHSRGLSCNTNHVHHPYWRLDFDIDGNGLDQVFRYDMNAPDTGWGPGGTSTQMRSMTRSSPRPIGCGSFATNPPDTAYGFFPVRPIVP